LGRRLGLAQLHAQRHDALLGARDGFDREHAILGASPQCVAVHPSDMAVALAALDAVVRVTGPDGARAIAMRDFFVLPGDHPERE
ncbi:hypothetical protein C6A85_42350, partial [Mycobacterium sp. ITM-2017-0098]